MNYSTQAIEQRAIEESEAIRKLNKDIIESGANETLPSLGSIAAIGEMLKGNK